MIEEAIAQFEMGERRMDLADIGVKCGAEEKIKRFRKAIADWYDKEKTETCLGEKNKWSLRYLGERDYAQQTRVDTVHSILRALLSDVSQQ